MKHRFLTRLLVAATAVSLLVGNSMTAFATTKEERIAVNKTISVESNARENWPQGPQVSAASAILMEINSGTILYEKNIHAHQYPASTTKILTTLIAAERCSLDEIVTFSHDAVFGIDRGSNHIAMDVGESLTVEECLNAILIRSANEVSYAIAEHIGTTWDGFAEIMNNRAKELGCVDSHFVNPNGLPNEDHYTSAYDLAMIGRAFFANDMLCKITTTSMLNIPASERQPDDILEWNKMELLPGRTYAYEYLVGCKTGYTEAARSALVSCAEKDGLKLICVVLRDEAPFQYEDTIALFDYGFNNFEKINISQKETRYNIENTGLLYEGNDVFGTSKPILSLNQDACVILPKTIPFESLTSSISYDTKDENQVALITYSYEGIPLGTASVDFNTSEIEGYSFGGQATTGTTGIEGTETENLSSSDGTGALTPQASSEESSIDTESTATEMQEAEKPKKDYSGLIATILKILAWGAGIVAVLGILFLIVKVIYESDIELPGSARRRWKKRRRNGPTQYRISPDLNARQRRNRLDRDSKRRRR